MAAITGAGVSTVPAEPRTSRPGRRPRRRQDRAAIVVFLLPAVVLFTLLVLAPIVVAVYTSLFSWNGLGGLPTDFVGLDNYVRMFSDKVFVGDLQRGLLLIVLSVVVQLPLALGIALLLNQRLPGRAAFRLLFFAPYVLAEVIAGVLFTLILSPEQGLANHLLHTIGLGELESAWLADRSTVLYALFFVITWKYFGFHMVLYLAGRQNIPNELTEAAAIDGADTWRVFRYVTLPLLGPTVRLTIFLSVIGTIQLFDLVWVLTEGGPVNASETMAVTMFSYGFTRFEIGYATAISVAMFVISLLFALGYQRLVMRRDTEGAITGMRDQR